MRYDAPIAVSPSRPLLLGFVADVTWLRNSYIVVDESQVGWQEEIPTDIRDAYLADGLEYKLTDDAIRAVAEELKAGDPNPIEQVGRVWKYVNSNFRYRSTPRPNDAPVLLKCGFGTCSEFTRLTVSLMRACGLPAREIESLRMNPGGGPVVHNHCWAEAYLPGAGWIPVQTQLKAPVESRYRCDSLYYLVTNRGTGLSRGLPYRPTERVIAAENTIHPSGGANGLGWFIEAPEANRTRSIEMLQSIAADDGTSASNLLAQVTKRIHKRVRPVMFWALAGSPDAVTGQQAAEKLVAISQQKNQNLKIELFLDCSPYLIQQRIVKALGEPRVPKTAARFGDNRYQFFGQTFTWHRARKHCEALGGRLVTIDSEEEQEFVAALPGERPKGGRMNCWIGLSRKEVKAPWQWVGDEQVGYINFRESQSTTVEGSGHFVRMDSSDATWVAAEGLDHHGFICEWE